MASSFAPTMAAASAFSTLTVRPSHHHPPPSSSFFKPTTTPTSPRLKPLLSTTTTLQRKPINASSAKDTATIFFSDESNPTEEEANAFTPASPPEGFVPPTPFDELPPETDEEVAAAYEEIYGPAYSGESVLGNDVYVMDAKVKKVTGFGSRKRKEKVKDGFDERVVQVRRVTKVVKGGKQLHFRAIVIVGDKQGNVGVGVGKAKEVIAAVEKSAINARRNIITVPLTKYSTFPHR